MQVPRKILLVAGPSTEHLLRVAGAGLGLKLDVVDDEAGDDVAGESGRYWSVIVARSPSGQAVAYPPAEVDYVDGRWVSSRVPAGGLEPEDASHLAFMALAQAHEREIVGTLVVEFTRQGDEFAVSRVARGPHRSGAWTLDACVTSHYENHLRAVADLPLGDPGLRTPVVATRAIWDSPLTDLTGALLHCYARDRRLRVFLDAPADRIPGLAGHVTAYGEDRRAVDARVVHAVEYLQGHDDPRAASAPTM